MGYLNNETATKEVLADEKDEDKGEAEKNNNDKSKVFNAVGWLRLGDLGYIDDDGFVVSLGRAHDAITLRSGAVVMPQPLEQLVRVELPCVRHVLVVGEQEDHVAVLMTLKTRDDAGEELTEEAQRWFRHARLE